TCRPSASCISADESRRPLARRALNTRFHNHRTWGNDIMSATTSRPATLIPWPSWNEPFARTPRGYLARRETLWKCLMIFVGFASLGVSFCLTPIFIPVLAFLIFCAAVVCVVKVLPIRSVLREAREKCEPWRDQWLAFEQASAEFLRQVREREFR